MKPLGSKHSLVVSGGSEFELSMLTTRHLPETNIIEVRRASMCQQINHSLQQLVSNELLPFYPLSFPHGLDFASGAYVYQETVPRWWYLLSHQQEPSILPSAALGLSAMFPMEVELVLLAMIDSPHHYVQASRSQYHIASTCWWQVVQDMANQWFVPSRRLTWWGWHLTTRGPLPTLPSPAHVFDPHPLAGDFDEFEVDAEELMRLNLLTEREVMRELGYESDEWVFWRAAQLALEQGMRDSEELGWPHPIGITGSPMGFRLLYDDDDVQSDSLSWNGSDV